MSKKASVSTERSSERSSDNDKPSTATEFAWQDALADKRYRSSLAEGLDDLDAGRVKSYESVQSKARHYLLSEFVTWFAIGVAIYALVFIISAAWHEGARS